MSIENKYFRRLERKVIGLDSQRIALETALLNFKRSRKGGSIVLSGRRGSGKSLLLNEILANNFESSEIIHEDGDLNTNLTQPLRKLQSLGLVDDDTVKSKVDEFKKKLLVIIIDHFEYFTSNKSQNFLYTLLNGTHQFSWFVIMIGISQDCVSVPPLEKRVYSRLSKAIINFNVKYGNEQMFEAFYQFLDCFRECSDEDFKKFQPRNDPQNRELLTILNPFLSQCRGLMMVKRLVALFLIIFPLRKKEETCFEILKFCANSICAENDMVTVLREAPLRQLCLLHCFSLLEQKERRFEFLCRTVLLEYRWFINTHGAQMLCVDDSVLYKDIEELIKLSAVTLKGGADIGDLQFRKVCINVESETVLKCMIERNLPIEVSQWLKL